MSNKIIKGYKGFGLDWKCNEYQFSPNTEHTHKGDVKVCSSGFHFCENPIDVFGYYGPGKSRFAEVEGSGKTEKHNGDSKVSCETIKIGAEISLTAYIQAAVKFVFEKAKLTKHTETKEVKQIASNSGDYGAASNSGYQGAASNSGTRGAASNSGDYGAASNSGTRGAASNSGTRGAASNSGYQGAASNSGYQGAASNSGKEGCAVSLGIEVKAKGGIGSFLTIAEWEEINNEWHRIDVKSVKVDGKKIKADVWYTLKSGKFVEVK